MQLLALPPEVLQHLLLFLTLPSLAILSQSNRFLHELVENFGFRIHALGRLSYAPVSSAHRHNKWKWSEKCHYGAQVEDRWRNWECEGTVLGGNQRSWSKCMPVICLWPQSNGRGRIIIGRGVTLEIWEVDELGRSWSSLIEWKFLGGDAKVKVMGSEEVTGISLVDGKLSEIVVSRVNGKVQRFQYEPARSQRGAARLVEKARYSPTRATPLSSVTAIACKGSLLVSASTFRPKVARLVSGTKFLFPERSIHKHAIHIYSISAPWTAPSGISVPQKPWAVLLTSTNDLVVGSTGASSLSHYQLSETGEPLLDVRHFPGLSSRSSIYSLCSPSALSSAFRPDSTVIAAYYDSAVRLFDLRSASTAPVLELSDPGNDDPAYSVASGGPAGSYIVVGTARNSAIRIFDVRSGTFQSGSTAFAPGRDSSPVYGVGIEYGKIWGVTDQRAFAVDFEPNSRRAASGESVSYYVHEKVGMELRKSVVTR